MKISILNDLGKELSLLSKNENLCNINDKVFNARVVNIVEWSNNGLKIISSVSGKKCEPTVVKSVFIDHKNNISVLLILNLRGTSALCIVRQVKEDTVALLKKKCLTDPHSAVPSQSESLNSVILLPSKVATGALTFYSVEVNYNFGQKHVTILINEAKELKIEGQESTFLYKEIKRLVISLSKYLGKHEDIVNFDTLELLKNEDDLVLHVVFQAKNMLKGTLTTYDCSDIKINIKVDKEERLENCFQQRLQAPDNAFLGLEFVINNDQQQAKALTNTSLSQNNPALLIIVPAVLAAALFTLVFAIFFRRRYRAHYSRDRAGFDSLEQMNLVDNSNVDSSNVDSSNENEEEEFNGKPTIKYQNSNENEEGELNGKPKIKDQNVKPITKDQSGKGESTDSVAIEGKGPGDNLMSFNIASSRKFNQGKSTSLTDSGNT